MIKTIRNLCAPALIYLIISMVSVFAMVLQNVGNTNQLCIGNYGCSVGSTAGVLIADVIYVVFWSWILNLICKSGHTNISWLLVLLPYMLMFILLGILMLNQGVYIVD